MWHVVGKRKGCTAGWENENERDLGISGRILLDWLKMIRNWMAMTGFALLRIETSDHGSKPSGSIKRREFLD